MAVEQTRGGRRGGGGGGEDEAEVINTMEAAVMEKCACVWGEGGGW